MIALFKDFSNRFHFGYFRIVDSNYCMWNTEGSYIGVIKRKKGTYTLYKVYDEIVALLTLD